jgi:LysR substrate binding domain
MGTLWLALRPDRPDRHPNRARSRQSSLVSAPPPPTYGARLGRTGRAAGRDTAERRHQDSPRRLLGTFRAEWPGVQIVLHESRESADPIHAVETGDIDVTFIDIGPYETGLLQVRRLLNDSMMLVAPAGAPEAGRRAVSINDVAHLPMIGTRNPGCRQIIDSAFRQAAVLPTYLFRSDDTPTIQGLIGSGLAYAVLPQLTVDENDPDVAVIPIRPEPAAPARDLMASRPKTLSRPPALRQRGSRNLPRPRRAVGGVAYRVTTG